MSLAAGLSSQIEERLRAVLPAEVAVVHARDLAGAIESSQRVPAVQIYDGGFRVEELTNDRMACRLDWSWICVCAVRKPQAQVDSFEAREAAYLLGDQVIAALLGWKPPTTVHTRFRMATPPRPQWSKGGFGYLPLVFTTQLTVRGEPQRTGV